MKIKNVRTKTRTYSVEEFMKMIGAKSNERLNFVKKEGRLEYGTDYVSRVDEVIVETEWD